MSEIHSVGGRSEGSGLFQLGAGLGVAAVLVGLAIFLAACFGFGAAFLWSPLPLVLGVAGLGLSIASGVRREVEPMQVLVSLLVSVVGIVGALLEVAAWRGWEVLGK